ncbi:MAG TPA: hypothetical protein VNS02_03810 [Rhizobiaceae bacterium]|nr:hypothetical protein [Rhizobiaceae bacterium]
MTISVASKRKVVGIDPSQKLRPFIRRLPGHFKASIGQHADKPQLDAVIQFMSKRRRKGAGHDRCGAFVIDGH